MLTLLTGNREQGFTVLEVVVCLLLMGLAVSLVMPSFQSLLTSITGATVSRKVVKFCQQIRSRAIRADEAQQVVIKDNKLIYEAKEGETFILEEQIRAVSLQEAEDKKISFFPDGSSSGGEITVTTDQNEKFTVIIDPITGKCRLEE
jgi:general secretion pathway protein H